MKIKTVQWNIGGGYTRNQNSDPRLASSYSKENLDHIIELLQKENPDIITLQEIHEGGVSQTKMIAETLGLKCYVADSYDNSHLKEGCKISLAIISRFPITSHNFQFFLNPKLKVNLEGKIVPSHDKGVTSVKITLEKNIGLIIKTLHLVPFKKTGVDPLSDSLKKVREDIEKKLMDKNACVLTQGDFNFDQKSLKKFLPKILDKRTKEILQDKPTTPKGRRYDHIIYRGLRMLDSKVISSVLTDHFPIITKFETD